MAAPFPFPSLITAGGSLLAALLVGTQKAAERKRGKEDYWELLKKRLDLIKGEFKPKTERYAIEKHLPQWDEFMKKALMGSYAEAFGQDGTMPSAANYLAQMFGTSGGAGIPGVAGAAGGGTMGMSGAMNALLSKRGLGRDIGRNLMPGFGGSYA